MADPELALHAGETVDHLVGRAGDDELPVQQLVVAHRRQRARARAQRELRSGARAHADRREPFRRRTQSRSHAPDEMPSGLERLRLRLGGDGADEEAEVVRRHGPAHLGGALPIEIEQLARDLERHQERYVRVAAAAGPHRRLWAGGAGNPDGRVWLLERQTPRIDVAEVIVAALPAERARLRPALQDQIVALLEALAVVDRIRVGPPGLDAD